MHDVAGGPVGRQAREARGRARQDVVALAQTARCVISVTAIADALALFCGREDDAMTDRRTYEGWWDLSLIDERNERPLHVAFVAVIAIWAAVLLFALI